MTDAKRCRQVTVMPDGGFCFGVRGAVDAVDDCPTPAAVLGEIAHNPTVMEDLRARGVRVVYAPEEIRPEETVIIRSHGIAPEVAHRLESRAHRVIDATCPRVRRAQRAARDAAETGWPVVVVGRADHPEVEGVVGHAGPGTEVVSTAAAARALSPKQRRAVVFQTTFDPSLVEGVLQALREVTDRLWVRDTICTVVAHRRETVARMAREVDAVVVVGGANSSNTAALAQVVKEAGTPVHCVEKAMELPLPELERYTRFAVVGGTSTPLESLQEVARRISGC